MPPLPLRIIARNPRAWRRSRRTSRPGMTRARTMTRSTNHYSAKHCRRPKGTPRQRSHSRPDLTPKGPRECGSLWNPGASSLSHVRARKLIVSAVPSRPLHRFIRREGLWGLKNGYGESKHLVLKIEILSIGRALREVKKNSKEICNSLEVYRITRGNYADCARSFGSAPKLDGFQTRSGRLVRRGAQPGCVQVALETEMICQ
jgi:hypothetical protein